MEKCDGADYKITTFSTKNTIYKVTTRLASRAMMNIAPSSQTSVPKTFPSLW